MAEVVSICNDAKLLLLIDFRISIDERTFSQVQISIEGELASPNDGTMVVPLRRDLLRTEDHLVLVRYKLYATMRRLKISLIFGGVHFAGSPIVIDEVVLPSECDCPGRHSLDDEWLESFGCDSNVHSQIKADLAPFNGEIDVAKGLEEAKKRFGIHRSAHSFCHYVIKDNDVFRECFGEHVGFSMFTDAALVALARLVTLPDTELLINLGDWPLIRRGQNEKDFIVPMISWCKTNDTFDVLLPTYEITEATLECMGR